MLQQIAFVDTRLADWQTLISGLDPAVEVILLDPQADGLLQIAQALAGRSSVDAIHILSHGSEGTLFLGTSVLSEDNLDQYGSSLEIIGNALSESGDLLLYGCNVAAGDSGQAFIQKLAEYTKSDVSASTNLTGSSLLGGDWQLEASTGTIETTTLSGSGFEALLAAPALTAAGTLDSGFSSDGKVTTNFVPTFGASAQGVVVLPDGKIVAAGYTLSSTADDFAVARYNADGSLDSAFSDDGKVVTSIGTSDDIAEDVAVQADGRIVVAGYSWIGGNDDFAVVRYNTDGSLDSTFDGDGKLTTAIGTSHDIATSVAIQTDGKIVVAGYSWNGANYDFALARYNGDGSLDTTFSGDGKLTTAIGSDHDRAEGIVIQADGKIVVAGSSWSGANYDLALVRYNSNGTLDNTFDGDGILVTDIAGGDDTAYDLAIQSDGRIVVGGGSNTGTKVEFSLVRYNTNGTPDSTLDGDGKLTTSFSGAGDQEIHDLVIQADGKIVAAGTKFSSNYDFAVARYDTAGALDGTFSGDGKLVVDFSASFDDAQSAALLPDGTIVMAGSASGFGLIRLIGGPGFPDQSIAEDAAFTLTFSAGIFTDSDGDTLTYTATKSDGSALPAWLAFNAATRTFSGTPANSDVGSFGVTVTAADPGALSASDTFVITVANTNDAPVLSQSGALDSAFDGDGKVITDLTGNVDYGNGGALQADGKIVVVGTILDSVTDFALARYNADGSLDTAFGSGGKVTTTIGNGDGEAHAVAVQGDGRIVVVGYSQGDFALARYNTNGSLDTTFDVVGMDGKVVTPIGGGEDVATSVVLQTDGKIVVAGYAGPNADFALARYNTNGTLDLTFDGDGKVITPIGSAGDIANGVALQSDGKIVVAGQSWNGSDYDFAVVRYTTLGAPDSTFGGGDGIATTSFGSTDEAFAVAVQPDGKIVLAGWTNSSGTIALARYNTNGTLDTAFDGDGKVTTDLGTSFAKGYAIALQPDGKIVVSGESFNGVNSDFALVRYNANGSLDTTFDGDGSLAVSLSTGDDWGNGVIVQADGDIVVAGTAGGNFGLMRVRGDAIGLPDAAATEDAPFIYTVVSNTFADPDGDAITYSATFADGSPLTWLSFNPSTLTFAGTPTNSEVGLVGVKLIGTDASNASGSAIFTISVANTNDPPFVANAIPDKNAEINNPFSFTVAANAIVDPDPGDALVYTATKDGGPLPSWLSFDGATRTFSGAVPSAELGQSYNIKVVGTDISSLSAFDTFTLTVVTDVQTMVGTSGPDSLFGGTGNDTLHGLQGNDTLDGGTGNDSLVGGTGDDTFIVDSTSDTIVEVNGGAEGNDVVQSSATYTLPDSVEILLLTGGSAINGTGNLLNNQIVGNGAANRLDGGQGIDTLSGGDGNDTYVVDNTNDLVVEAANAGQDLIEASVSYDISAGSSVSSPNVESLTLTGTGNFDATGNTLGNVIFGNPGNNHLNGGDGNDTIHGLAGDDTLDGGLGADSMLGGTGNDTYIVDNAGDAVVELANEGTADTVRSSVTWTLDANVENLILTGSANVNGIGNTLSNQLIGNAGTNVLTGGDGDDLLKGADTLNGSSGADTLIGGTGNDVYYIDSADDVVLEGVGEGTTDQIFATPGANLTSLALPENVERVTVVDPLALFITGNGLNNFFQGNDGDDLLRGAAGNDTLLGAGGNDTLDGGSGIDSMVGGSGNDIYYVDNAADLVIETTNGPSGVFKALALSSLEGVIDTVIAGLNYSLANLAFVENLTLTADASATQNGVLPSEATGNDLANILTGNPLANTLKGLGGNDTLNGGLGIDTAVYTGARSSYTVSGGGSVFTVTGPEGTDSLRSIERVQFSDTTVQLSSFSLPPLGRLVDFSGDGKSDFVLRNANGTIEYRLMDGVHFAGFKDDPIPTYWSVLSTNSDFNGDGKSDVVIRNADGTIEYRLMDGVTFAGFKDDPIPTYWSVVSTDSDFNGDGKSDVVLRHDSGIIEYRLMDGVNLAGYRDDVIPTAWKVVGTDSDFNADGKSDVVIRNDSGIIEYRLMDGVNLAGYRDDIIPTSWKVVSTDSDFNADGKSDLVIRHESGIIEYRLMDGVNLAGYRDDFIPTYWKIVSTDSDFNGDGKSDVVLRHDNGTIEYRLMDGVNMIGFKDDPIPTYWSVVSTDNDFNGDGKSDVVIRHDNGTIEYRLMDGVNMTAFLDDPIPTYWSIVNADAGLQVGASIG